MEENTVVELSQICGRHRATMTFTLVHDPYFDDFGCEAAWWCQCRYIQPLGDTGANPRDWQPDEARTMLERSADGFPTPVGCPMVRDAMIILESGGNWKDDPDFCLMPDGSEVEVRFYSRDGYSCEARVEWAQKILAAHAETKPCPN